MIEHDQELDASGLNCPLPLLKAKLALNQLDPGQVLKVKATDSGSQKDFQTFASLTHYQLINTKEEEGVYSYWLYKPSLRD